jgi:hypothetical protein
MVLINKANTTVIKTITKLQYATVTGFLGVPTPYPIVAVISEAQYAAYNNQYGQVTY